MVAVPLALQPLVEEPSRAALFVDFDGSLSAIVPDPPAATVLPASRAALSRLVPVLRTVAVVSGRPVSFLAERIGLAGLQYVGAYGLERLSGGVVLVDDGVLPWVDAIARAATDADVALPGLLVERKGQVAVTIHWRGQPDRASEAIAWADATAARLGLQAPLRGRMAVELRPPVPVDKGTTVAELALACGASVAAFAGDDAGDLPAFAALRDLERAGMLTHAVTIGVASEESPAEIRAADVVVDGPDGLAVVLDALADELSARA